MEDLTVTFSPHNKTIEVPQGTDLLSAALKAGIYLTTACGGEGTCGKCIVHVRRGKVKGESSRLIPDAERKKGAVLACQSIVESDLDIFVPPGSVDVTERPGHEAEEYVKGTTLKEESHFARDPLVRKRYLELARPTHDDATSDLDRVYEALGHDMLHTHVSTKLNTIKHLGDVLRESGFKVTVTACVKDGSLDILSIEPGDTSKETYGFAFDIGTTTVTGQLIDLSSGDVVGTRIAYNKQSGFGSDIITRIIYASEPEGLEKLHEAVLDNINEMVESLAGERGIDMNNVDIVLCAGNVTMTHLLLKIDPSNIRREPYVSTVTSFPVARASEVGIKISPKGVVICLPGVSTYVGGDIVAGVLSSGLFRHETIELLIDIGTNGEMVLGNREWMIGCAASAGPAFEGSGMAFGMKAVKGAIQKVRIDERLETSIETIGNQKARGICGSGYIDLLSQMLKRGIITKDGKIDRALKNKRVRKNETGFEYVVAFKKETALDTDIVIQEEDIENLKRAKGAIYSAVIALLNKVEKDISDVKKIYIAGGFGTYIDIESAVCIGLLPDIDRKTYEYIGNSSLAGARMALLARSAFEKTGEIYKQVTYLDLGTEPRYMDEYIAALFFPHTDLARFPSVRSSR